MAYSRRISTIFVVLIFMILGTKSQAEVIDGVTGGLLDEVVKSVDGLLDGVLGNPLDGAKGTVGSITKITDTVTGSGDVTSILEPVIGTVVGTVTSGDVTGVVSDVASGAVGSVIGGGVTSVIKDVPVVGGVAGGSGLDDTVTKTAGKVTVKTLLKLLLLRRLGLIKV